MLPTATSAKLDHGNIVFQNGLVIRTLALYHGSNAAHVLTRYLTDGLAILDSIFAKLRMHGKRGQDRADNATTAASISCKLHV